MPRLAYAADLVATVSRTAGELSSVPPAVAARHPAPGKWSVQEIIGHLVDSASNNHQRFVRARWQGDLVFPTLDRVAWQPFPADQPATLDWFMGDYVGHLHHHLRQIDAILRRAGVTDRAS